MASLIYNGIKKNLPRWDVKIVCALHLLRKYQAVYDLVDMTREEVRKKFEQLECVCVCVLFQIRVSKTLARRLLIK